GLCLFASRRRHTSFSRDWSSDVCSSDLTAVASREGFRGTPGGNDEPAGRTARRTSGCAVCAHLADEGTPRGQPRSWAAREGGADGAEVCAAGRERAGLQGRRERGGERGEQ